MENMNENLENEVLSNQEGEVAESMEAGNQEVSEEVPAEEQPVVNEEENEGALNPSSELAESTREDQETTEDTARVEEEEKVVPAVVKVRKPFNFKTSMKKIGFSALGLLCALLIVFGIIAAYRHQYGTVATNDDVELSWADQYGIMTIYADSYTSVKNLNIKVTFRNTQNQLKTISMEKYFAEVTPGNELSSTLCETSQIAAALGCTTDEIYVHVEVIGGKIRNDVKRESYEKKVSDACEFTFKIRYHESSGKYLVIANVKNNSDRTITSVRNLAASVNFSEHGVLQLYPSTLSFATPRNEIPSGSVSSEFLIYSTDSLLDLPIGGFGTPFEIVSTTYVLHSYAVSN